MIRVYIAGPRDSAVEEMFIDAGFCIVTARGSADLVCFTGGEDISPSLYGEEVDGARGVNLERDMKEVYEYREARRLGIPMVGICRGAQFLNVMNGGKLKQHIDGHSYRIGRVVRIDIDDTIHPWEDRLLEDHHQGMVPASGACIIGVDAVDRNPEILWYENSKCLCFQAHPEWGDKETRDVFFELIKYSDGFIFKY